MQLFLGGKPITLDVAEDALVEDVKLAVEVRAARTCFEGDIAQARLTWTAHSRGRMARARRPWRHALPARLPARPALQAKEGTPAPLQRLLYAGRQLADGRRLGEYGVASSATLTLSLRLRGGKGGFGSLLRGAGKAKLIDNFDACRDLQASC